MGNTLVPSLSALHAFMSGFLMHMLTCHPIYRSRTWSAVYPQSLSPFMTSFSLCSCEHERMREPWKKIVRGLWSCFFPCGCGCCVFKHNICGNQLEVPDYTLESPNSLSLECFAGLRCPLCLGFL